MARREMISTNYLSCTIPNRAFAVFAFCSSAIFSSNLLKSIFFSCFFLFLFESMNRWLFCIKIDSATKIVDNCFFDGRVNENRVFQLHCHWVERTHCLMFRSYRVLQLPCAAKKWRHLGQHDAQKFDIKLK